MYEAALARFLSQDPARSDPNLYWYAGNDPVNRIDPSGLQPLPNRNEWSIGDIVISEEVTIQGTTPDQAEMIITLMIYLYGEDAAQLLNWNAASGGGIVLKDFWRPWGGYSDITWQGSSTTIWLDDNLLGSSESANP